MTKPIGPDDIAEHKLKTLPSYDVEAWNEIIAKNYSGSSSIVKQDDAIELIQEKYRIAHDSYDGRSRQMIFDEKWLEIEPLYEAEGWKVEYDKPDYNETYGAFFTFRKKR